MRKHLLEGADNAEIEGTANEKRTKKRKIGVSVERGSSNGTMHDTLSKEQRKELKRLKKHKAEDDGQEIKENGAPEAIGAKMEEKTEDRSAAKTVRKKIKAELKAAKRPATEMSGSKDVLPSNMLEVGGEQDNRKIAAKAARKAEKAQLKAAKKLAVDQAEEDEMELKKNEKGESSPTKPGWKEENGRKKSKNDLEKSDAIGLKTQARIATAWKTAIQTQHTGNKSSVQSAYEEDPALTALPQSDIDSFLSANFIRVTDPISPNILRPILNFSQFPKSSTKISPFTNFKSPTPIQAAAWPFLLSGRDVVGVAETGSGKTLAFGVPCIRSIATISRSQSSSPCTKAVIVSPTRELAVQIHDQISKLASAARLHSVCIYGGVPKDPQRRALPTAHIIVATPGRLNDLISEGAADLSGVTYLVLDEADRMLDTGFEPEIRKIIDCTPSTGIRQTLMFTATWPPSVRTLASSFMRDPVHIGIGRDNPEGALRANTSITQRVEVVEPYDKEQRLLQLIKEHQSGSSANDRILVFCLYKKEATRVEGFLRYRGLRVAGIHGDLSQERRSASLDSFKNGDCPLLVATDVASRGLDIPAVKLVLNVTFPLTVEDYVHRIGRTGRAGSKGLAITLFTEHDKAQSGALINVLKAANQPVPEELLKFGTTVKKKGHDAYGAFYKDIGGDGVVAKKIKALLSTNTSKLYQFLSAAIARSQAEGRKEPDKEKQKSIRDIPKLSTELKMKAVDIKGGKGTADALFINDATPKPQLNQGSNSQALVKIIAFGLNRMDLLQREGHYPVPPQAPKTLGVEFSGVVESLGNGEEKGGFKVGDEVFGLAYGGAYAEYISVSTNMLLHKPKELSWEQAAGIPETWITALQAFFVIGEFSAGKTILWHAGASSVSIAGIQLSIAQGASAVYITAGSSEKIKFCTQTLGATAGYNYHTQDWAKEVLAATDGKGVDIIIDFVGQNYFQQNLDAIAKDGRIVHLGSLSGTKLPAGVDIGPFVRKRIRFEGSSLRSRDEGYQKKLRDLFEEHALPGLRDGRLKVFIERVYPWEEVVDAQKLLEQNGTMGKVICTVAAT